MSEFHIESNFSAASFYKILPTGFHQSNLPNYQINLLKSYFIIIFREIIIDVTINATHQD